MLFQTNYVIRSKIDGKYLTARLGGEDEAPKNYLLVFAQDYDALSYLNTHAVDLASKLAVESMTTNQVKGVLQRWGFQGLGVVKDPLLPRIEFMS